MPITTFGGKGTNLAERQAEIKRRENSRSDVFQSLKMAFTRGMLFRTSGIIVVKSTN
jgi:hypothetical protein